MQYGHTHIKHTRSQGLHYHIQSQKRLCYVWHIIAGSGKKHLLAQNVFSPDKKGVAIACRLCSVLMCDLWHLPNMRWLLIILESCWRCIGTLTIHSRYGQKSAKQGLCTTYGWFTRTAAAAQSWLHCAAYLLASTESTIICPKSGHCWGSNKFLLLDLLLLYEGL